MIKATLIFLSSCVSVLVGVLVLTNNHNQQTQSNEGSVEPAHVVVEASQVPPTPEASVVATDKSETEKAKKTLVEPILPEIDQVKEIKAIDKKQAQHDREKKRIKNLNKKLSLSDEEIIRHFEREIARVGEKNGDALNFDDQFKKEVKDLEKVEADEFGQILPEVDGW